MSKIWILSFIDMLSFAAYNEAWRKVILTLNPQPITNPNLSPNIIGVVSNVKSTSQLKPLLKRTIISLLSLLWLFLKVYLCIQLGLFLSFRELCNQEERYKLETLMCTKVKKLLILMGAVRNINKIMGKSNNMTPQNLIKLDLKQTQIVICIIDFVVLNTFHNGWVYFLKPLIQLRVEQSEENKFRRIKSQSYNYPFVLCQRSLIRTDLLRKRQRSEYLQNQYNHYQSMENQNANPLHFIQSLKLHSQIITPFLTQQAPVYQSTQAPLDFYLSLELKGSKRLLEFYQSLANLHPAVIEIKAYEILPVSCKFFQRLMKTQQQVQSATKRVYMKYYNFSLNDWIQLKKTRGSKVEQEEIIYIIKILLTIAAEYKRIYNQNVHMFNPKNIFITNSWKIVIYPFLFPVKQECEDIIFTGRKSYNSPKNDVKIYKQQSIGTNSSESTLQSSRVLQNKVQKSEDKDLTDIFILVLELITFKKKEYFFSSKHNMMKWDLVRQFLNDKIYVGHLQADLLQILKEITEGKLLSCQVVLQKLQQVVKQQQEINFLRRQNEKRSQENSQKLQEQMQRQRKKNVKKTIRLNEIGVIKKRSSIQ